jgi:hypothetical protein
MFFDVLASIDSNREFEQAAEASIAFGILGAAGPLPLAWLIGPTLILPPEKWAYSTVC